VEVGLDGVVDESECSREAAAGERALRPCIYVSGHRNSASPVKVFLAATSLRPSYGGPARSVSRLSTALAESGINVGVWASDQSAVTTPLLRMGTSVRPLTGTLDEALAAFGHVDVLHDNGMWLSHNHQLAHVARARGIPRVVSTRGMLEPWALNHKRLKKRLAWWLYQRSDLRTAQYHHTTADVETRNVQRLDLGVPVGAIPNGVDVPALDRDRSSAPETARKDCRTALFVGRIYPVKGLPMLIAAWARIRPHGWRLKIAGPDEAGHRAAVEKAAAAAGVNDVISFAGPLDDEAKRSALFDADLFVLPSHSESFGVALAEAMAHGVPVLTTTAVPWPMLRERGCGWQVDPTVDGIARGLREAMSLDAATLQAMGANGRELVATEFGWERIAKLFVVMYDNLLCTS
jgi:glycosyltransferase involved in cell wall biosynthesis